MTHVSVTRFGVRIMSGTALQLFGLLLAIAALAICLIRSRYHQKTRSKAEAFSQKLLQAHEQERKQLAAELHGSLGQNLLIIKNRAELALSAAPDAAAAQLKEISHLCSLAIDETRRTAHNLGPRHLEQLGLTEALDAMIDRVANSTRIRFKRKLEKVDDLFNTEAATNIYRIVQEALNNVMKHAQASEASVWLIRDVKDVQLIVQDNGCGFEKISTNGHGANGGLGLAEIGERVRILNGKLEIDSGRDEGTRLTIKLPVREATN
jgi:signal transduction histidine kinase